MGMMNMGGSRGTIGMPVPQGARWLGQPAGPRPAQVNEQMQPQAPMGSQLPPGPTQAPLPGVLGGQSGMPLAPLQTGGASPIGGMGGFVGHNPWAQQPPPPQRSIGPQMRNPLARLLAGG